MLNKDIIQKHVVAHLSQARRGMPPKVAHSQILLAILYRLKTGCQWRELPTERFFGGQYYTWQAVYHHFRKWAQDGSFQAAWLALLTEFRASLDLSSVQLDGSYTWARKGGQAVGYQPRQRAQATNLLFVCDNQGQMLACSEALSGEHHDSYQLGVVFGQLTGLLKQAGLAVEGLFLNADAGFDTDDFRQHCYRQGIQANIARNGRRQEGALYFDEQLYQRRLLIEQSHAWLDSLKALLVRFEQRAQHWLALHYLAFCLQFLRRLSRKNKL